MRAGYGLVGLACLVGLAILVGPSLTSASVPAPPRTFVMVTEAGQQFRWEVSVYSSTTGAIVRRVAKISDKTFTNNGLAYAPDGSAVYFTLIPPHRTPRFSLLLMRLDVATGRRSFVADGAQPALSGDGKQLAYGASPRGLAVRDLDTGQTRTIGLGQLGTAANLLNATIGWLPDGSDIAVIPSPTPWDLVGRPPKLHWCGTTQARSVIVFVHVPAPPARLTANCVPVAGHALVGKAIVAGDSASPAAALVAVNTSNDRTLVERITQSGAVRPLLTIPNSLPLSFDPTGTHLLYLVGHNPASLTEATIANGQLTPGPWRNPHLNLAALAW